MGVSEVDSPRFYTRQTELASVIEGLEAVLSQKSAVLLQIYDVACN